MLEVCTTEFGPSFRIGPGTCLPPVWAGQVQGRLLGRIPLQRPARLKAPRMAVRSNLDRQVADRLRAVAGEEISAAQRKVRAQVDKLVEEKTAPVKAKIEELRIESERRVADARARLDAEKRKLEERLKSLGGALVGLPRLPGS